MAESGGALEALYQGWELYQRRLNDAIAPLSAEQLGLSAAPQLRPVGVLAAHIISARVWWFHYILGEGSADLAPLADWDEDDAPPRTAEELVGALEDTWRLVRQSLDRWTAADLAETIRRELGGRERAYTRQWVIWHVIEHDLHHGGELSHTLGMHGLAAPDI